MKLLFNPKLRSQALLATQKTPLDASADLDLGFRRPIYAYEGPEASGALAGRGEDEGEDENGELKPWGPRGTVMGLDHGTYAQHRKTGSLRVSKGLASPRSARTMMLS